MSREGTASQGNRSNLTRWGLATLGAILLVLGSVMFLVPVGDSEKPHQVLVAGHWLDVLWEVGLPALAAGAALLTLGQWRARHH